MTCVSRLRVSRGLTKLGPIVGGLAISFLLSTQVGSTQPLVITPSSLSFTISPGGVDACYVEVLDLDSPFFSVKYDFDSGWMFLVSSEFKISPGKVKRISAVFFIAQEQDVRRWGEIVLRTENENKPAPVKMAISAAMAKEEKAYRAWIAIEYEDSYLRIRAFCFNSTSEDEVLRYKLQVKKRGKGGTAKSVQAGSVRIPSQEKKCLSQVGWSFSGKDYYPITFKDYYQITLEVYKDGRLVAGDSVFYPPIRSL